MDAGSSQQPAGSNTLKQLCPEDKEKVAKLLRQVVQLGQENAALRTKAEKADKDGKEGKNKINQWQDCNKQVILNNIRLKGKLSQLVTLLRMYHHKVQVLDAALRATQNQQGSPGSAAAAAAAAEAALQACLSDGQEQPSSQQQQLPSLDGGMAAGTGSSLPNSTSSTGKGGAPDGGAGSSSSLSALALCSPAAAAAGGSLSSAPGDRQAAGVVLLAPPRSQQGSPAMVCAPGQLLQFDPSVGPHGAFVLLDAVDLLSEEDQKAAQLQQPTALGTQQQGPPLALPSSAASPQPSNLDVLEQVEAWSPPRRGHHPAAAVAATAAAPGAAAASSMGYSSGAGLLGPGHSARSFTTASGAMGAGAGDSLMPNATWPSLLQQAPYSMNGVTGTAAGAGVAAGAAATIPTAWRQGSAAAADGVDASSPTRGKLLNLARAFDSLAGRQDLNQGAGPMQQQEQQAAFAAAGGGAWPLPTGMAAAARVLSASRSAASTAGAAVEPRVLHSSKSPADSHHHQQHQQRHVPALPPDQPPGFGYPWPTAASAPGHVQEVAVEADSSVPVAITKEPSWWHRGQAAAAASYAPEPAYSSSSNAGAAWGQTGPMQDWQAQQQSVLRGAGDASTSSSRRHTATPQGPPAAAAAIEGPYPPYWQQQQQQQHMDDMLPWQQQYHHRQQPPEAADLGWGVPQEAPGGAAPLYSPTSSPEAARPSWEEPRWGVSSRSLSAAGAGAVPLVERTVLGSFQRQGPSTGGQLAQLQQQQQQLQAPSRQQQVYSSASSSVRGRHTLSSGRSHQAGVVEPHVGVAQLRGGTAGGSGSGGTSYWSPPGSKWPVQNLPPPAPAAAASAGAGVSRRSRAASAAGGARSSSKGQALRPMRDAASTQQHSRAPLREMQQQQQGGAPAVQQGELQDWEVEPEVLEVCRSLSRSSMVSTRSKPSQQQPPQQSPQQQQQMIRGYLRTPRTSTVAGMPLYGSGRAPSLAVAAAAAAQGQRGHHRMSVASSCWDEEAVPVGLQQAGPAAGNGVEQQLLEAAAGDADSSSVLARYDESLMEVLLQVERLEQQHGRYQQELQHVQPAHLLHG